MKILQLIYESPGNPYGFGGAGVRAAEIYRRLAARHEITMACMRYPGAADYVEHGIRYRFFGTESTSLARSVLAYTATASRYVARHGGDYDVIVENFLPTTPFFSCWRTETPVVLQVQGVMEGHAFRKFPPWLSIPISLVERFYPGRYSRFIFVSPVTRDKVLEKVGTTPGIVEVIPNGIESGTAGEEEREEDVLLFFSRIDAYTKGLDLLLQAFAGLSVRFPSMRLVLAGTEFTPVESLLGSVPGPLRDKIRYVGFVSGEDKRKLLSSARVVVLPSRHESAPISLLEAASAGRPLVVSDIPELEYVAREGLGLRFSCGDSRALEETLAGLWEDTERRRALGERGRRYARGFLWETAALRFQDVLERAAGYN